MNVSQVFTVLRAVKGSSIRTTLSKDTLKALREKGELKEETAQMIDYLLKEFKNPSVTLSAKSSKQGFTIFGASVKDGERSVSNAATSVAGVGNPNGAVLKSRVNITPTSDVNIYARSFTDTAKKLDIREGELNMSLKNGVQKVNAKIGDASQLVIEAEGTKIPETAATILNGKVNILWQALKDLLARGKEIDKEELNKLMKVTSEERKDMETAILNMLHIS